MALAQRERKRDRGGLKICWRVLKVTSENSVSHKLLIWHLLARQRPVKCFSFFLSLSLLFVGETKIQLCQKSNRIKSRRWVKAKVNEKGGAISADIHQFPLEFSLSHLLTVCVRIDLGKTRPGYGIINYCTSTDPSQKLVYRTQFLGGIIPASSSFSFFF